MSQLTAFIESLPPLDALLQNGNFWVSLSFIGLLALLIYYRLPKMLGASLDAQRDIIAKELAEAQALYGKAQALLAEHQAKQQQQENESRAILAQAKQQAADYQSEQEKMISEKLARLEAQAKDKIEMEKKRALAQLHTEAMAVALVEAKKIITSQANQEQLANQSIQEIEATLNR